MIRSKFTLAFVIFALLPSRGAAQSKLPRQIDSMPGTRIAEKLRSDDEFVVVERGDIISSFVDERILGFREDLDERVQ